MNFNVAGGVATKIHLTTHQNEIFQQLNNPPHSQHLNNEF